MTGTLMIYTGLLVFVIV